MSIAKTGTITITADSVYIEGFESGDVTSGLFTCRTFALECAAWAVARLGEEIGKSAGFYATGEPIDNIGID
jgi:hypothetical protein